MNESAIEFQAFPKMARLNRDIIITEKLDGTNAQIYIDETGEMKVGSRNCWLTPREDNYGFARWAWENQEELLKLGPGRHYGEWWGNGIQRRYDMKEKVFSLFNVTRWYLAAELPACCRVVPTLYKGLFCSATIATTLEYLRIGGSVAAQGFMDPEGIVIYHINAGATFKVTLKNDEKPKGLCTA